MSGFARFSREIPHLDMRTILGLCLAHYKSLLHLYKGKKGVQLFEAKENEVTAKWKSLRCQEDLAAVTCPLPAICQERAFCSDLELDPARTPRRACHR